MDENYQTYLNRVMRLTLPETYGTQVQNLQESPKFELNGSGWTATPFPGYAVVTPVGKDDEKNASLYAHIQEYQAQVQAKIGADMLALVPPESFHVTLADLIWDSAYQHANESAGFEQRLRDRIGHSFRRCESITLGTPLCLQVIGLMVTPRAISVCLAPTSESAYERVLHLRRAIYQSPDVIEIGIEQQYNFTPHVTIGYFGKIQSDLDRQKLAHTLDELNMQWLDTRYEFWIHTAELRKFDDMVTYYREPDWATYTF